MTVNARGAAWVPLLDQCLAESSPHPSMDRGFTVAAAELLDQIVAWGPRVGLPVAQDEQAMVHAYFSEAAQLAQHCSADARTWLDLGSGPGALGLALALLRPSLHVSLVDPRPQRVAFYRTLGSALAPGRVEALCATSKTLEPGSWAVTVANAREPLSSCLEEVARAGSRWVWLLGAQKPASPPRGWSLGGELCIEGLAPEPGRTALGYALDDAASRS